jgi:hypothetical protein
MLLVAVVGLFVLFGAAVIYATFFLSDAKYFLPWVSKDGFKPTLGTAALFWVTGIIAAFAVGMFAFSIKIASDEHAAHTAKKGAAHVPILTPEQQREADYKARGFTKKRDITFAYYPEMGGPTPEQLPLKASLWVDVKRPNREGVFSTKGSIAYSDGQWVDLKVTVLYGRETTWKRADSEHFEGRGRGKPPHIENALKRSDIHATTRDTHYVYCYGLASSDTANEERNELRSFDRAAHLCTALANLGYVLEGRAVAVGLGYAKFAVTTDEQRSRQRSAIIVGVTVMDDVRIADVAATVGEMIDVDGVLVNQYSRQLDNLYVARGFGKGEYKGTGGIPDSGDDPDFWILKKTIQTNK